MAALIPKLRRGCAALLVSAAAVFGAFSVQAQEWGEIANISSTMGVNANRICVGEGSRGDIGCPTYAPTVSPTGNMALTAGLTVNSVSLTTAGTTWGYLGSAASYIPNLNTNNISLSTINGVSVSALGGSASPTNVPAFHVHKNGTNQTVSTGSWQKLTFNTKTLDTYTNFNTGTSRFTPTVAGNYLFTGAAYCTDGTACWAGIYKNGSLVFQAGVTSSGSMPSVSGVLSMNGTTDYAELYVYYSGGSGTVGGTSYYTHFSGSLLASGNGLISGTGTGVSAMSSLTDVTLTSPVANSILVYDGSKWVNKFLQDTVSSTSMIPGWPDAILCNASGNPHIYYVQQNGTAMEYHRPESGSTITRVAFNPSTGAYASNANASTTDCVTNAYSISQLYSMGRAFNFLGGNGTGNSVMGDRLTSGTLSVTANSSSTTVSLTTNGTTWGYLGSNASYLPNLATNNISLSTINGVSVSALGGGASPTNVPAFRAHRNGASQTVTNATYTKVIFTTKDFDTFGDYDTSTGRFTPKVAGNYLILSSVYCSPSATQCYVSIYKNGSAVGGSGNTAVSDPVSHASTILALNGSTDYIEIYVNGNVTTINGAQQWTYFAASLLASGNGTAGGAGVSAMSSLTDVTLTSPVSNSLLVYDGTKWVNRLFQDTVSTSTMVSGYPDALICTASGVTRMYYIASVNASNNPVYRYLSSPEGADYNITYTTAGDYSTSNNTTIAGDCVSKTLTQLYASGQAFNFLGSNSSGSTALGDRLTSGTLAVTANSATSVISLTTNSTTWGYLGSNASYIPNLATNNISLSTINGVSVSALGGGASPTNVPAFSAHKNGTNQTSVPSNTFTKITFSTKTLDTMSSFDTGTGRYTPPVAGNYLFRASMRCGSGSTTTCFVAIYKNGVNIFHNGGVYGDAVATASGIVSMNGTTDYVEAYGYTNGGTIYGEVQGTNFSGSLLASGNGLISGTGAGVSAMSSLTDVTLTSPVSNSILIYDGSKWVNKLFQDTVSTSTMVDGWPDAIQCDLSDGSQRIFFPSGVPVSAGGAVYREIWHAEDIKVTFAANKQISGFSYGASGYTSVHCGSGKSVATLYAAGRAFNFLGGNGSGSTALGDRLTSGTLAVTANSATSVISLTTNGTTWGYLGSNASYIPNLATNNISLSTINGVSVSALGGGASPTNVPAFSAHKNGTNQSVTASTLTKVTFSTEDFDTYNNFDTSTSRFTPTVAGKYFVSARVFCSGSSTECHAYINKNGANALYGISRDSIGVAQVNGVIDMNGTTDYLEVWANNIGGTVIPGPSYATNFSASLLASGNGLISATGAGVSAMSGLTDVSASSPANNSLLRYNGLTSKWEAVGLNDGTSSTSIRANFPDAIVCTYTANGQQTLMLRAATNSDGASSYRAISNPTWTSDYALSYTGAGAFNSHTSMTGYDDCINPGKSISQLYAAGQAFNFIGGNGGGSSTAMGDRLTSGTLSITANSSSTTVSLTTNGTTWGYLGSSASYLPNLSSNAISTSTINLGGLNLTSSTLVSNSAVIAFSVQKTSNQTVTADTWTKVTWNTKIFDTNNNFDLGTNRFTPTVAGYYYFNVQFYCNNTSYCYSGLYKNGSAYKTTYIRTNSTVTMTSELIYMNGTTDYVEAWGFNAGATTIYGHTDISRFSGFLVNGGSAGSGGGAGVSAMSSLTDVTLTSPVANSLLVYDGTKWVNKQIQETVSTSTIVSGWPDAIICTDTGGSPAPTGRRTVFVQGFTENTGRMSYQWSTDTAVAQITFNTDGSYYNTYQGSSTDTFDCQNKSISTLYAEGKAFNFIGGTGSGSTAMGDRLTSGTLSVTANSSSTTVSLTTNGTTWGYLGSNASYLPNLSTNALNVGGLNITSSTLVSNSAQVVFNVDKNGTNQTVTAGADTKLTWTRENIDTNSNFDLGNSRFMPTVPGYYFFNLEVTCNNTPADYCGAYIYKNGISTIRSYNRDEKANTHVSQILYLNGTNDYVEAYAINNDNTTIRGEEYNTNFRGFLLNGSGGSGGGGGTGDRITSGTTSVIANTSGGISITAQVEVSGSLNLSNNPAAACGAGDYGKIKQVGGRLMICRQ